jgi:hypothetical protein
MAKRGRPFEPGNKFGRGRPRGSRNKITRVAQELLESHAEPLVRKCLLMALQGDRTAMRLCWEYLLPARRDRPVQMKEVRARTAADISQAYETLLKDVACGELTPSEAETIATIVEKRHKAIDTKEHEQRIKSLEEQHGKS